MVRAARFDFMVRNFFEMFLRARRALEFSHSQAQEARLWIAAALMNVE
jgi:hypothetical protein